MDASSASNEVPGAPFTTYALKSSVDDPGDAGEYVTVTCCHVLVSVTVLVAVPASVEPAYSRKRRRRVAPGVSDRTHMLPV
jgi:hypothetical protein